MPERTHPSGSYYSALSTRAMTIKCLTLLSLLVLTQLSNENQMGVFVHVNELPWGKSTQNFDTDMN